MILSAAINRKILFNPSRLYPWWKGKINLNFYFYTSLWCIKTFYEGHKDLHKTFWGTTKKCENKDLNYIFILIPLSEMHGAGKFNNDLCIYADFGFIFSSTNASCNIWKHGTCAVGEEWQSCVSYIFLENKYLLYCHSSVNSQVAA